MPRADNSARPAGTHQAEALRKPHIGDPVPPTPVAEQDAAAGHHLRVDMLTALARPETSQLEPKYEPPGPTAAMVGPALPAANRRPARWPDGWRGGRLPTMAGGGWWRVRSGGDRTMRVVPLVRKVLCILLAVACFGLAVYALVRMVQGGSCASGRSHVLERQCPPGTSAGVVELPLGIIAGLVFISLSNVTPDRKARPTRRRPASTIMAETFHAGGERPAGWPAHLPWPPAGVDGRDATVVAPTSGVPPVDQDPLVGLERLRALGDAGAVTSAEYDAAKARILGQL